MDGFVFSVDVPVRFAETDAQGIVHNSVYLVWFEVARVEYLARYTGGYQRLRDLGLEAIVTDAVVGYRTPARFGDTVAVHARCRDVRGARFRYEYVLDRAGTRIAEGWTAHAIVDARTLRPTRVPQWLGDAIAAAEAGGAERPSPSSREARRSRGR